MGLVYHFCIVISSPLDKKVSEGLFVFREGEIKMEYKSSSSSKGIIRGKNSYTLEGTEGQWLSDTIQIKR